MDVLFGISSLILLGVIPFILKGMKKHSQKGLEPPREVPKPLKIADHIPKDPYFSRSPLERHIGHPRGEKSSLGKDNDAAVAAWMPGLQERFWKHLEEVAGPEEHIDLLVEKVIRGTDRIFLVHADGSGKKVFKAVDVALPVNRNVQEYLAKAQAIDTVFGVKVMNMFVNKYAELLSQRAELALREILTGEEFPDEAYSEVVGFPIEHNEEL